MAVKGKLRRSNKPPVSDRFGPDLDLTTFPREGRFPNLLCKRERNLASTQKRTFRQAHAAAPGGIYIEGGELAFAAYVNKLGQFANADGVGSSRSRLVTPSGCQ